MDDHQNISHEGNSSNCGSSVPCLCCVLTAGCIHLFGSYPEGNGRSLNWCAYFGFVQLSNRGRVNVLRSISHISNHSSFHLAGNGKSGLHSDSVRGAPKAGAPASCLWRNRIVWAARNTEGGVPNQINRGPKQMSRPCSRAPARTGSAGGPFKPSFGLSGDSSISIS